MKDLAVAVRNIVIHALYRAILKPIFFRRDPEEVHDSMMRVGEFIGKHRVTKILSKAMFGYFNPTLEQEILGIKFKNPVGLAAGFDKDAKLIDTIPSVGFGFMEVGSITGSPCAGNPKPRLWRLKKSKGLVVYYGLKSDGAEKVVKVLDHRPFEIPVGTSVAMTNCKDNLQIHNAINDYAKAFRTLAYTADYFTVNVSCPNAQGGQPFMEPEKLDLLLGKLDIIETDKPVFIKLSPDVTPRKVDAILEVLARHRVEGIVISNLTKERSNEKIVDEDVPKLGGISGKPVQDLSDRLLAYIYLKTKGKYTLVGCGGIFNAEDAYRKIKLGANLLQMVTGMIFEGPQVISEINRGLVKLLKKDGYTSIKDAVGVENGLK